MVKSLSDTTIYAPALQRKLTAEGNGVVIALGNDRQHAYCDRKLVRNGERNATRETTTMRPDGRGDTRINEIVNFVESVHLDQHPEDGHNSSVQPEVG